MDIKVGLSIYNKPWLIEASAGLQLLDFFERIKTGDVKWDYQVAKSETEKRPSTYSTHKKFFAQAQVAMAPDSSWDMDEFTGFEGAQIAVIPVTGPMMKKDFCGSFGTNTLKQLTQMASAATSVQTILFVVDSPGGTVDGTKAFADAIAASPKRTIAIVDGLMCSAGYWIGSSCKEVYASSDTDQIGCIGTMISFYDNTKALEARGIVLREYKATDSKDKNTDVAEAYAGNGKKLIQGTLDPLNDVFLGAVRANRGSKINEAALTGTTYTAGKAAEMGLIDGVKSFEAVLDMVQKPQGATYKISMAMDAVKTLADFKAQYPGLFAEAIAEGATAEKDRIESWLTYNEIDPTMTAEGIASGKNVSEKQRNEFFVKGMAKARVDAMKEDNAAPVTTAEPVTAAPTPDEANVSEFLANCKKDLGLK